MSEAAHDASLAADSHSVIAVLVILGFGGLGVAVASGGTRRSQVTSRRRHESRHDDRSLSRARRLSTTSDASHRPRRAVITTTPTTPVTRDDRPTHRRCTAPPPLRSRGGRSAALRGQDDRDRSRSRRRQLRARRRRSTGRSSSGRRSRACDTTGTQTDDGYTEAAYTLDVVAATARRARGRGRERRDDAHDERRLGTVHRRARRDRKPRARRCGHLDPRRRRPGGRARLSRAGPRRSFPGTPTTSTPRRTSLGVDVRDAFLATGMPTSTYYATDGHRGADRSRRAQSLERPEGVHRDREHAQRDRRRPAESPRLS